ncbi:hypothetical protein ACTFIZ_012362 [Dictyostelium cf. discoideum]
MVFRGSSDVIKQKRTLGGHGGFKPSIGQNSGLSCSRLLRQHHGRFVHLKSGWYNRGSISTNRSMAQRTASEKGDSHRTPGIFNSLADELSRPSEISKITKENYGWTIKPHVFNQIQMKWGPLQIDLFASHTNHRLDQYSTFKRDAMNLTWNQWNRIYLFPPPLLIPMVVKKLRASEKDAVVDNASTNREEADMGIKSYLHLKEFLDAVLTNHSEPIRDSRGSQAFAFQKI